MVFHGGMYAVFVLTCTFNQNITQIYVNIFLIGLLFVPRSACIFTYIMEITPDKFHDNMMFAVYMGDGITFVISGIFTKYTRDVYLFLQLISYSTIVSVIILWFLLPESPRFLYSSRQYDKLKSAFLYYK